MIVVFPFLSSGVALAVEVGDSDDDEHVAVRTEVPAGLTRIRGEASGWTFRREEGSKETWERSWTGVGLIDQRLLGIQISGDSTSYLPQTVPCSG